MKLAIDRTRRRALMRAHSATHILHYALQQHIPETAQAGSLVEEDMLRFDFTTKDPLTPTQLEVCEDLVNERIRSDYPISTTETTKDEAVAQGAKAFFEDKYGDSVRMVTIHSSVELCGGTHCASTSEIGAFVVVSQEAVASGIRRITAYTGPAVATYARDAHHRIESIAGLVDSTPKHIEQTLEKLQSDFATTSNQLTTYQQQLAHGVLGEAISKSATVGSSPMLLDTQANSILAGLPIKVLSQYVVQLINEREVTTPWLLADSATGAFVYGDPKGGAKERLTSQGLRGGGSPTLVQGKDKEMVGGLTFQ